MDGLLESFIPLISKKDRSNSTPNLGHQTNTLPLAHLHMKRGWHPAPVHSFTLPLWFGGLYDEQRAARQDAAIFDRSHLGRFYVTGAQADQVLRRVFASNIAAIPSRGMRRVLALRQDGTILDIPTLCHLESGRWLIVTGPQTQVHLPDIVEATAVELGLTDEVSVHDRLTESVLLSVQGPRVAEYLEAVVGTTIPSAIPEGEAHELLLGGYRALVAHTSQIAEDGYWFVLSPEIGEHFWENSVSAGLLPAGLAAHDVLRIEAGVLEAPYETPTPATPISAGLESLLQGADKESIGAFAMSLESPSSRVIKIIKLTESGLAKRGDRVYSGGEDIGACVNAGYSAQLEASIALAYLEPSLVRVEIEVGEALVTGDVLDLPLLRVPSERVP
tara:strand:+ start:667 stop:1833 length:1167 start_codon:yes stop_codon:yes gene_type:complete